MTKLPEKITGLEAVRDNYDALLCDVWGVIHNGVETFPGVVDALTNWKTSGGTVLLLTNAPRPARAVQQRLEAMGCPETAYDGIMSSGDAARRMLMARAENGDVCHFVGAPKDVDLLNGIDIDYAPAEEADFVLLAGMRDDLNETLEDYQPQIEAWGKHNLPVICANPDRIVQIGDRVMHCAGAMAERHEQNGGDVIWLGKPYQPIYETAAQRLKELTGLENPRTLAVGDGFKTDILGANKAGLDVIFVTGGLAETLGALLDTPEKAQQVLRDEAGADGAPIHATYFLKYLVW